MRKPERTQETATGAALMGAWRGHDRVFAGLRSFQNTPSFSLMPVAGYLNGISIGSQPVEQGRRHQ